MRTTADPISRFEHHDREKRVELGDVISTGEPGNACTDDTYICPRERCRWGAPTGHDVSTTTTVGNGGMRASDGQQEVARNLELHSPQGPRPVGYMTPFPR